jgi:hypothetical protein
MLPWNYELTGKWRKSYEELKRFCSSSSGFRVIKSRGLKWTGNVRNICNISAYEILVRKLSGRGPLLNL